MSTHAVADMLSAPTPYEIRGIVSRTFGGLAGDDDPVDLNEHVVISEGEYVARSYRWRHYFAMWLIDVGLVQFYDDEGNMLRTINLFAESPARKKAA